MKLSYLIVIMTLAVLGLPAQRTDLADSLMAHGEYYRAITEYYKFVFGDDPALAKKGHQGIREAFLRGQDWEGLTNYLDYQRSIDDYAYLAWAWINLERPDLAAIASADGASVKRRQMYAVSKAFQGDFIEAEKVLREIGVSSGPLNLKLMEINAATQGLPRKNPVLAGTMSIVPGLGYAYNGHWDTAVASFAVNLLWLAVVFELVNRDLDFSAAGVASVGLGFYMGNIFGAARQAKKININRRYAYLHKHLGPIIGEEFLIPND